MESRPAPAPSLARAHLHCRALTARNPLHDAARRLGPGAPYRLFTAAYATMRVADDLVDEGYLAWPAAERRSRREEVRTALRRWRTRCEEAARGVDRPAEGDLDPLVFTALAPALGGSDLGDGPFLHLADRLEQDLDEAPLGTWEDFLDYCEGAAVAPGAVFVYLLGCREEPDGLRWRLEDRPEDLARPLARFCYLTHIVRDLALDAGRHPRLLTVPRQWLEEEGLDEEAFRRALLAGDDEAARGVVRRLLEAAGREEQRWRDVGESLRRQLPVDRWAILDYLYGLYRITCEQLRRRHLGDLP